MIQAAFDELPWTLNDIRMSSVAPSHATSARSSATLAPPRSGMYAPHPHAHAGATTFAVRPINSRARTTLIDRITVISYGVARHQGDAKGGPPGWWSAFCTHPAVCRSGAGYARQNCSDPTGLVKGRPDTVPRTASQRNPDPEEPEAPSVEVRIEQGRHPAAVVVERLVVEPALIDSAPGQIRRWRAPVPAAVVGPTVLTRPSRPAGPARAPVTGAAVVALPTGAAGTIGPARAAWSTRMAGPTRPRPARPTGALAVAEVARRPRLGRRQPRTCAQGGGS